jgi:hypothetical protein
VAPVIDLDIAGFKVTKQVQLKNATAIRVQLVVKNHGSSNDQMRPATVVGTQNGVELYREMMMVSDPIGNGRTTFEFPALTPMESGDILWTATIVFHSRTQGGGSALALPAGRAAARAASRKSSPVEPEALAVPADHGLGLDGD